MATGRADTNPGPFAAPAALGQGILQRRDPRAKLLAALGFTLVVAVGPGPAAPLGGVVLGLGLAALAGLPWGYLWRRGLAVNAFVALLWVFLPWRLEWSPEWRLAWAPEGLDLALVITLKVNAVFLAFSALLGSTSVTDLLHALSHLGAPRKLVTLFLLIYRYLFVLHQEYARMREAMRARCFRPGNNLHTYRTMANLVGMLLVRSLDRAERVWQAMLCRGFGGTFWLLDHFAWRRGDTLFCLAGLVLLTGLAWLRWGPAWS